MDILVLIGIITYIFLMAVVLTFSGRYCEAKRNG